MRRSILASSTTEPFIAEPPAPRVETRRGGVGALLVALGMPGLIGLSIVVLFVLMAMFAPLLAPDAGDLTHLVLVDPSHASILDDWFRKTARPPDTRMVGTGPSQAGGRTRRPGSRRR